MVTHGQCYLSNIWCYYLACALGLSRVAVNLHSVVNSLRVCCSVEWLPLRRHLFAYEPWGNNSKSPHLLCKMNPVPLTHTPRADRLCLSCRFPPAAARGSCWDVIRWWVGDPNPNQKGKPVNLTFILTLRWSSSLGGWTDSWAGGGAWLLYSQYQHVKPDTTWKPHASVIRCWVEMLDGILGN